MDNKKKFIKIGRIYWIEPLPQPNMEPKIRPGIAIDKYSSKETIFIHLGSKNPNHPDSKNATKILRDALKDDSFRPEREIYQTYVWIDSSKPELNSSIIKPHYKKKYIDIDHNSIKKIKHIFNKRIKELEKIRINKAKGYVYLSQYNKAKRQLIMLKNSNPKKHKNLDVDKYIEKIKKEKIQ